MTFDFFKSIDALEQHNNLFIKPNKSLSFPSRDVQNLEEICGKLIMTCNFMGLYGVDSPLPAYLNNICLEQDEKGQILRDILDIINHRIYILYFLSWKAFQPVSNYYLECIKQLKPQAVDIGTPIYSWEKINNISALGDTLILGDNILLGEHFYTNASRIHKENAFFTQNLILGNIYLDGTIQFGCQHQSNGQI